MRRWWSFLCFCLGASVLGAEAGVEVRLSSDRVVEVSPGKILTAGFLVRNTGDADAVYEERFGLPAAWLRISPPAGPVSLRPGQQELRLVAFAVPMASPAGSFDLEYVLTNGRTRAPVATETLTVVVRPVAKLEIVREDQADMIIAGEVHETRLRLVNRGNSRLKVSVSAKASPDCPVRVDTAEVWMEPAATHLLRARIGTDVELRQSLTQVVRFEATATGPDGAAISAVRSVAINVIPRISGDTDPYVRLPAQVRMTAVAEDGRAGAQGEFSGSGYVDEQRRRRIDFLFRGPGLEDQSIFGLQDQYSFSYYSPVLDLHVGDHNYSLSPLTQRFNYGRGVGAHLHPGPTKAGAFYMETLGRTRDFETAGAYVRHDFTPVFSLQANALHKSETGLASSPGSLESVGLVSLQPRFEFGEGLDLELEYGANADATGLEGHAHRAQARGRLFESVTYALERVKAGNEFFGYYHATESTQATVTFPVYGPLRGKASFNQAARDAYADSYLDRASPLAVYAGRETAYRPGLMFKATPRTDLSLEYQHIERHAESRTAPLHSLEESARFGVGHSRGKLSVQNYVELGTVRKDRAGAGGPAAEDGTVSRYSTFVSFRPDARQSYSVYGSLGSSSSGVDPTERTRTLGASAQWRLGSRLGVGLNYARNHYDSRTARVQDTASGTISYTRANRHVAAMQARWRDDSGSGESVTSVSVSYTIPFGLPVSKKKGGGVLRGRVFEMVGGVSHPLSRVVVTANGITAVTDRKGAFVFPSLRPGRYQVNIEQSSLGANRVTLEPLPLVVEVEKETTVELSVGVVDAARVRAKVTLHEAGRGAFAPDAQAADAPGYKPLGGFAKGLVELTNGRDVLRRTTDAEGIASFDDLRPGKWTLRVYDNNLPPHHRIETAAIDVEVEPGQVREVPVRVLPVRRVIRFIDGGVIGPGASR